MARDRHRQAVRLGTGVTVSYVAQGDRAAVPVVLLHAWGESLGCFGRLLPLVPGSRLVVYEDTGHLVLRELPERVAGDLTDFVQGLSARGNPS